ncbi:MAG: OmpA family protein [Alphaproteobacteria bacterium]|nr:OmpA family protein [Alphaproteobacteria bacterium]
MADESNHPVIIIKRGKKGHDGAHGGGWKVAYADFVTAMMAFFLLLWLLNATDQEKRQGIAQYFTAFDAVSRSTSGAGGVLGGVTLGPGDLPNMTGGIVVGVPLAPTGEERDTEGPDFAEKQGQAAASEDSENPQPNARGASGIGPGPSGREAAGDKRPGTAPQGNLFTGTRTDGQQDGMGPTVQQNNALQKQMVAEMGKREEQSFQRAEADIRQALQEVPDLKPLAQNILVDRTPEGLRIQLVDQERYSMFPSGSSAPAEQTRKLLATVAKVVQNLPNAIAITGHTDAVPFPRGAQYTNWELSSDRANAARRALIEAGLPAQRIARVVGRADTEPLIADNPSDPRNRRISIILLRDIPAAS